MEPFWLADYERMKVRAETAEAQLTALQAERQRLQDLLDFQQGNYEDVSGDDLLTPDQMAEMQASFNAFVAARQERAEKLADYDRLKEQLTALQAENEKLFKELAYEVDQRRQVENLMQLEVSVAAVRCLGNKHHWSESADAEGDTCDCGEWYRFADRIESSR